MPSGYDSSCEVELEILQWDCHTSADQDQKVETIDDLDKFIQSKQQA